MDKYLKNKYIIFLFAFPGLLLFTAFAVYPLIPEIFISFQKHDGFASSGFVGVDNYISILHSAVFWKANLNNLILISVSTLLGLPTSFFLAYLLDNVIINKSLRKFFKITSFLPAVLSVTVICQMWKAIFQPGWGLLDSALNLMGLYDPNLVVLSDEKLAIWAVAAAFVWQFIGFNMVIYYTGMKSVPKEYYEAARIDGATGFKAATAITLPLMSEISKFLLVISILGCMAQFAHVNLMTLGGPGDASRTLVFQIINTAIKSSDFGAGSATAILFVIECLIITFIINCLAAKEKIEF